MNCIGTKLIAVLRLYYIRWNEQKSASRNAESLKQEVRRTEFSVKRGKVRRKRLVKMVGERLRVLNILNCETYKAADSNDFRLIWK